MVNWCSQEKPSLHNEDAERAAERLRGKADKERQLMEMEDQILHLLSTSEVSMHAFR